jgi:hypothetical protein
LGKSPAAPEEPVTKSLLYGIKRHMPHFQKQGMLHLRAYKTDFVTAGSERRFIESPQGVRLLNAGGGDATYSYKSISKDT